MKNFKSIKTIKLLALLFVANIAAVSCSSDDDGDDHGHHHDEELITTVTYRLTNGTDVVTLEFQDLDGDGSAAPTYDISGPLTANTTYTGSIQLLNETENPADNITEEVQNEGDEHEFFISSSISDIAITKTDVDENGNPIGIESSLTTGNAGTGTLTVILKHEPTKPNDGTADGAGGSTDVQVTFNIEVQ
ncbi:type 1 periplasmic binding fold superfamily protein [Winogradskyella sp. SYSU M77433]|uniref:type 1 periplasmic binding fold superfamily protein n=1 Tax=Winogradskyella sp. SYSU M77433 TaxID=3042722 RepID=UPI002481062B|nr:type 1 periplasmic binding fold superfamily protein [Winogradskyella sp. SYSU M77433]MDH7912498.1 type 1 periplasmic binding fold superfamily protein [Winogradskyella sp. SYSU M77433]